MLRDICPCLQAEGNWQVTEFRPYFYRQLLHIIGKIKISNYLYSLPLFQMCLEFLKNSFQIMTCALPEHLKIWKMKAQLFCKVKYFDDNKFFLHLLLPTLGDIVFIAQFVDNPSSYSFFFRHCHYKSLLPFGLGTAWNLKLLFAACQLQNNLRFDAFRHSSWNTQKEYIKVECVIFSLHCTASVDCIELYLNC